MRETQKLHQETSTDNWEKQQSSLAVAKLDKGNASFKGQAFQLNIKKSNFCRSSIEGESSSSPLSPRSET